MEAYLNSSGLQAMCCARGAPSLIHTRNRCWPSSSTSTSCPLVSVLTSPFRQTSRRNKTPPPSTTRLSAPPQEPANLSAAVGGEKRRGERTNVRRKAEKEENAEQSGSRSLLLCFVFFCILVNFRATPRWTERTRTCMPSRAKLIPSAGSGSSGGTSSAGSCTSHVPSGFPYRHRFSLSGSHCS